MLCNKLQKLYEIRKDKMKIIAHMRTDFPTKFGVPRQSGVIPCTVGRIVFEKEYRDPSALRGLEDFSHIWVLWKFSKASSAEWSPTVRPPLLGGNKRMGVFATRSPFRPNSIGLSVVKIERIEKTGDEGTVIWVSGCDMIDKTPIFDIKPYLPYCDSIAEARGGFTDKLDKRELEVSMSQEMLCKLPHEKREILMSVLKSDPRPSYQDDEERIYGFEFCGFEIKFKVCEKQLTVIDIEKTEAE